MNAYAFLACAILAIVAGCASPPQAPTDPSAKQETPASVHLEPLSVHGTYWMPTSIGMDASRGNVSFVLNASDARLTIQLHLGLRQLGIEAPASPGNAMVRLVDATDRTIAQAMLMLPAQDAKISTSNASVGPARLVFDTHGGSDGQSAGDHVDFDIAAIFRQA